MENKESEKFVKSSVRWTPALKRKALVIALEAERTAERLDAGVEKKFGTGEAFDEKGQPVCAFGCVLSAAHCLPEEVQRVMKMPKEELKKLIEEDEELYAIENNVEAFAKSLGLNEEDVEYGKTETVTGESGYPYSSTPPSTLRLTCDRVGEANDDTKSGWERRRKKIAKALRNFSKALLQDSGLL